MAGHSKWANIKAKKGKMDAKRGENIHETGQGAHYCGEARRPLTPIRIQGSKTL